MSIPSQRSVIHAVTVLGTPYLLFMEQEVSGKAWHISCISNKEFPQFRMAKKTCSGWRLYGNIPYTEQFEEKITQILNPKTPLPMKNNTKRDYNIIATLLIAMLILTIFITILLIYMKMRHIPPFQN